MNRGEFLFLVGTLFTVVAVLHGLRAALRWELIVHRWRVPVWVSAVATVLLGGLAYKAFQLM